MPRNWTRIVMKGKAQVIPAVCPNCLGSADLKIRYGYKGLEGWVTRTTYYQTFAYCGTCHPQAASAATLRRWGYVGVVLGFIATIAASVALSDALRDPVTRVCTSLMANLAIAGGAVVGLGVAVLTYLAARYLKRRRHPLQPSQAVWGQAAFYTGSGRWGLDAGTSVYVAAQPQWIAALARANPEQVDEATYQGVTGTARPSAVPERPFGPA